MFTTIEAALEAANRHEQYHNSHMLAYECWYCGKFHFSHDFQNLWKTLAESS